MNTIVSKQAINELIRLLRVFPCDSKSQVGRSLYGTFTVLAQKRTDTHHEFVLMDSENRSYFLMRLDRKTIHVHPTPRTLKSITISVTAGITEIAFRLTPLKYESSENDIIVSASYLAQAIIPFEMGRDHGPFTSIRPDEACDVKYAFDGYASKCLILRTIDGHLVFKEVLSDGFCTNAEWKEAKKNPERFSFKIVGKYEPDDEAGGNILTFSELLYKKKKA